MGSFAKIDENNIVIEVIACDEKMAKLLPDAEKWIQTSRNTIGGVHMQGKKPLRMNYAAIGFTYDPIRDAFIPPKIYDNFILDETTCLWIPPIKKPEAKDNYDYIWNFETNQWDKQLIVSEESA